jgi:hypothetical protein
MSDEGRKLRYAYGVEWKNNRGVVHVQVPDHPNARADGFYVRARVIMEEQMVAGNVMAVDWLSVNENSHGPIAVSTPFDGDAPSSLRARFLEKTERVYHIDGDTSNDDPSNLALFANAKALAQFRSRQYHGSKNQDYRDRIKGLTEAQKELREELGVEAAQLREKRQAAGRKAQRMRKEREKAAKKGQP